jgi:2-keto-4-pentenoate hydratase
MTDRTQQMAQWMWDARQRRLPYDNLPENLTPASIAEAYAAQDIYYRLAEPVYGAVGGAKIATTTKVMQELMGINHACGGAIFSRTIHASPAKVAAADFVNLRIESEIALKLGADLPARGAPWTRETVAPAVAGAMPAFELIEDRNADYSKTAAIRGRLRIDGKDIGEGRAEDPAATLAWLANLLAERGRDLKAGMVVITGSLIATVSIARGQHAQFSVEGLGDVAMEVV